MSKPTSKDYDTDRMKGHLKLAKTTASIARKIDRLWLNPEHASTGDDKPFPASQYRVISIPNPSTKLNLGQWVSNPLLVGLGLPFGYPGISMDTIGEFYARAAGNALFQVGGSATFRSASAWTQFAKGLDLATEEKTTVASGASITIAAGPKGSFVAPPNAGPALSPPAFDKSGVNSQLLDHFAASDEFLMSALKEVADLHKELGLPGPEAPKKNVWKSAALWLHKAAGAISGVKGKVGKVKGLVEASAQAMETADKWLTANAQRAEQTLADAKETRKQVRTETESFAAKATQEGADATFKVAEAGIAAHEERNKELKAREAKEAAKTAAASGSATPAAPTGATGPTPEEKKKERLANANQFLSQLNLAIDQVDRETMKLKAHHEKVDKSLEEHQDYFNKSKDYASLGHLAKATSLVATFTKTAEAILGELEAMLDEQAASLVLDQGKAKVFVTARDAVQLSSGKQITAYAAEGFRIESDKGGLLLHAKKAIEARALASAELTAKDNLLLQGHKGAELSSKGPVAVGSRESEVEVIAPKIRLGTLDPSKAQRKTQDAALGGTWTDGKQKPTTHLMGAAKELVTLQAGGKAPGGEELKLDAEMPAAIALRAQEESAEVWAKKKIVVEADESSGEVRLNVGKFVLTITAKKAVLGLASKRGDVASTALLSVDDKGEVRAETKGARLHLKEKGGSFAMRDGNSHVSVGPTGTKADGAKINLG